MKVERGSTDEKIIVATFSILQKEGAKKATTKKIAKEAGVNEVTIFRKFETKNNLIEIVKDYYLEIFISKMREIFDFTGDEEIEEYLKRCFRRVLNLPETDFSVIKIAMEEVRDIPDKKLLISNITDSVLVKLEDFFKLQNEKGNIREVNPKVVALMCFSLIFQSVILWKIYNKDLEFETNYYADDLINIMIEGINP